MPEKLPEEWVSVQGRARLRVGLYLATMLLTIYDHVGDAYFVLYSFDEDQRQYRLRVTGGLETYRDHRWSATFYCLLAISAVLVLVKGVCAIKAIRAPDTARPWLLQLGGSSPFAIFAGRRLSTFLDKVDENIQEHPSTVAMLLAAELILHDVSMLLAQLLWISSHWYLDTASLISVSGGVAGVCISVGSMVYILLKNEMKFLRDSFTIIVPIVFAVTIALTIWAAVPSKHPVITPPSVHCDDPSDERWMKTIFTKGRQLVTSDIYIRHSCPLHLLAHVEEVRGTVFFEGDGKQYNESDFSPRIASAFSFNDFQDHSELLIVSRAAKVTVVNSSVSNIKLKNIQVDAEAGNTTVTEVVLSNVTVQNIQTYPFESNQLVQLNGSDSFHANMRFESSSIGNVTALDIKTLNISHSSVESMTVGMIRDSPTSIKITKSRVDDITVSKLAHAKGPAESRRSATTLDVDTVEMDTASLVVVDSDVKAIDLDSLQLNLTVESSAVQSLLLSPNTKALRKLALRNVTQLNHIDLSSIYCPVETVNLSDVFNLTMKLPLSPDLIAKITSLFSQFSGVSYRDVDLCFDIDSSGVSCHGSGWVILLGWCLFLWL
eukprot:m.90711 g.90711  ORF g.90711 m.90711 type:complete len:604 (-) comp14884_c0_seq31:52-1863(-)